MKPTEAKEESGEQYPMFVIGQTYSRAELHALLGGGSMQSYLPSKNGVVLAGCFGQRLNPKAPDEVYVGSGPKIISGAERAVQQKRSIPCFLKDGSKAFRYVGHYQPVHIDRHPESIRRAEAVTGRNEIWGILHLRPEQEYNSR